MKKIYDSRCVDYLYTGVDDTWENAMSGLSEATPLIVYSSCQRWNGKHKGGRICDNIKVFYNFINYADDVMIVIEHGKCHLTCFHHDGTDYYEIRCLTDKGKRFFENYYCKNGIDTLELFERIMKSRTFSKSLKL